MSIPVPKRVNYRAKKRAVEACIELERLFPIVHLAVELVPIPCWGRNLRSRVSVPLWELIRKTTLSVPRPACAICGANRKGTRLECHEIWQYEDESLTQRLVSVIPLCSLCHEVKHLGLAGVNGRGRIAESRLRHLNGWTAEQSAEYLSLSFSLWQHRSKNNWRRDLSWLVEQGYPFKPRKKRTNPAVRGTLRDKAAQRP